MVLIFLLQNVETFLLNFAFQFFYDLFANKSRKLEFALESNPTRVESQLESNPIMENFLPLFSLFVG